MMTEASPPHPTDSLPGPAQPRRLWRWLPALLLLLAIGLGYGLGLQNRLSLPALIEHRDAIRGWVEGHFTLALAGFAALYVAVVALSLPAAAALSLAGGFLFGWMVSAPVTTLAATAGAAIVFEIVKTSLGATLAERSGPFLTRLSRGFAENGFGLLLFLRLTPVFPFWAVNAVAGLSRMPLSTFLAATLIGIIPGSIAFALIGAGLDGVIDDQLLAFKVCAEQNGAENCHLTLSPGMLISPELLWGLTGLGVVALLPTLLRLWRNRPR
ncbi:TVP38/TMEM64 family protein [Aestuariivirga litoralis]|uniref:TVP38/TMEM64 family membrane protein n=1 Tax=Aestuariivirga litoralis TaxID=2650924 RepID=A0A2W2AV78_9HYPH|nr:VTT domain-containing protein [Aestuariivirga litoralis]PZF76520.1 TVP38/TMEM64 family protein [Aestuariivirga litoralis]